MLNLENSTTSAIQVKGKLHEIDTAKNWLLKYPANQIKVYILLLQQVVLYNLVAKKIGTDYIDQLISYKFNVNILTA